LRHAAIVAPTHKQTNKQETAKLCSVFAQLGFTIWVNVIHLQLVSRSEKLFLGSYRFAENIQQIFQQPTDKKQLESVVLRLARLCTWESVRKEIISLALQAERCLRRCIVCDCNNNKCVSALVGAFRVKAATKLRR